MLQHSSIKLNPQYLSLLILLFYVLIFNCTQASTRVKILLSTLSSDTFTYVSIGHDITG